MKKKLERSDVKMISSNRIIIFLMLFLIALFSVGCDDSDTVDIDIIDDQVLKEEEVDAPCQDEEMDFYFRDIIDLMAMSKNQVFEWWGSDYEQAQSEGKRIDKYRDKDGRMIVYFTDLVDAEKIDRIEFECPVDINGVRVGMAYDDILEFLTEPYNEVIVKRDKEVFDKIQFKYEDFYVIMETGVYDDELKIARIRIVRSIPLENLIPLLFMSEKDLVSNFGGEYQHGILTVYDQLLDINRYVSHFFGLEMHFDDQNGLPYNRILFSETKDDFRLEANGAFIGMNMKDIESIFGEPEFHGPCIVDDYGYPKGELLLYEKYGGKIRFFTYEPGGACAMFEYINTMAQ